MSSVQTTNLIKTNKDFIVGYFQSKYKSNVWSFMNNKSQDLKRSTHGASHIRVIPGNAEEEFKKGHNVTQYYYITASTIKYGNGGWRLSIRSDLMDCISSSGCPAENYHFLVVLNKCAMDITYKELKSMKHEQMLNQMNQVCLLYALDESKYFSKSLYKPKYTSLAFDKDNPYAYYEPSFRPECIGNVKYTKKYFKGLWCIDIYEPDGKTLRIGEVFKGVNMVDLWKDLNRAAGNGTELDCSSATAFQNKVRKGRDVKITNTETREVLLARIRQLEKRVEVLEEENKQLKVRVEKVEKDVVELKETKADKSEVVEKEDLVAFKKWVAKYCAEEKNKLTVDVIKEYGFNQIANQLLVLGVLSTSKDYLFIHWDLLKDYISKAELGM